MRNKLLKAVSTVMASLVFAGAFVFISPKADVRAEGEIDGWYYFEGGGKKWVIVGEDDYKAKFNLKKATLPDPALFPEELLTDGHL